MSENQRKEHVLLWESSGLSKAAYCRRENLTYSTFCSWCREYEDGKDEFILLDSIGTENSVSKPVEVLLPNGIELNFPEGIDLSTLKELMYV